MKHTKGTLGYLEIMDLPDDELAHRIGSDIETIIKIKHALRIAPYLLEACKALLKVVKHTDPQEWCIQIAIAEEAIAKAEGR